MALFADRSIQNFGEELPLLCPVATFPRTLAEFASPKRSVEETIASINDVFSHPSIDLSSIFIRAREAEDPPSLAECRAIQDFVAQSKIDIDVLDAKIPQMLKSIITLCQELSEASCQLICKRDQVRLGEYILSPPKHLPHDILEQIFLSYWESMDSSDTRPHIIPLRLARVCHRWRSVALATPKLWSRIHLAMTEKASSEIAKLCISRSHTISLTLRTGTGALSDADDILAFLRNSSIRISHLSLEPINEYLRDGVRSVLERHTRNAEELVMFMHMLDDLEAPKIKRLYVGGLPETWQLKQGLDPTPLRFSQFLSLTVLCFQWDVPWPFVHLILDNCSELRSLSVCVMQSNESSLQLLGAGGTQTQHRSHANLEYLAIVHSSLPPNFLQRYSFPKLRSLGYRCNSGATPTSISWLVSHPFLAQITQLVLVFSGYQNDGDTLMSIVHSSHSLQKLTLTSTSDRRGILKTPLAALTSLSTSATSTGHRSALLRLQEIQIISPAKLSYIYRLYGEVLSTLLEAWSTTESDISIPDNSHPHLLARLIIRCRWHTFSQDDEDPSKNLLSIGRSGRDVEGRRVPEVQVHREKLHSGSRGTGFETWPLPFSESPWFEVLQEDGSWEMRM